MCAVSCRADVDVLGARIQVDRRFCLPLCLRDGFVSHEALAEGGAEGIKLQSMQIT